MPMGLNHMGNHTGNPTLELNHMGNHSGNHGQGKVLVMLVKLHIGVNLFNPTGNHSLSWLNHKLTTLVTTVQVA